jgi:hypothetical protein
VRGVQGPRLRELGQDRVEDLEQVGLLGADLDAVAGMGDRRADQLPHRHRAEAAQRLREPGGGSGNPARRRPDVEHLRGLVKHHRHRDELGAALHAVAPRNLDEEVEQHVLAVGMHEHESAGAQPGERALDGERRQHRAHRGVDRVAAVAQDLRPRLGGQPVARGYRPGGYREGSNSGASMSRSRGLISPGVPTCRSGFDSGRGF